MVSEKAEIKEDMYYYFFFYGETGDKEKVLQQAVVVTAVPSLLIKKKKVVMFFLCLQKKKEGFQSLLGFVLLSDKVIEKDETLCMAFFILPHACWELET